MNLTGIATRSIMSALQRSLRAQQRDMMESQQEVQTGQKADASRFLGELASKRISLVRDAERLGAILDSNKLATNRLGATQAALDQMRDASQGMLDSLSAVSGGVQTRAIAAASARSAASVMVDTANTAVAGHYIFAGLNTDVAPISTSDAFPGEADMQAAFFSYFGFTKDDAAALAITPTAFETFLDTQIEALFTGAGWGASISQATDEAIHSRITLNEVTVTSASANEASVRVAFYAAAISAEYLDSGLSDAVAELVSRKAIALSGEAVSGLADLQGRVGFMQQKVADADKRIAAQKDLFSSLADDMTAVDPYEAATRLNTTLTQIETSYTLTQKILGLSLMKYLD